jgi:hypothetical protein
MTNPQEGSVHVSKVQQSLPENCRPNPKRPYRTPHLSDLGHVGQVTKTLAAGPNFDGGGGANIYAS